MDVYNPLYPQNTTLIQSVTHTWCQFVMKDNKRPDSTYKSPNHNLRSNF